MNTNALRGMRCSNCGNTESFDVEIMAKARVIDSGTETITDTMWEADAGTTCTSCGQQGTWESFQDDRPFVRCARCPEVIYLDGEVWKSTDTDRDPEPHLCKSPPATDHPHEPLWLTLGEIRARLAHLPDATPITLYTGNLKGDDLDEWANVSLPEEIPTDWPMLDGNYSLIFDVNNNFDTRQW